MLVPRINCLLTVYQEIRVFVNADSCADYDAVGSRTL